MISLHVDAVTKALLLIDIGVLLCTFPIGRYGRVVQVHENLLANHLFASDLDDICLLADSLLADDQVPSFLKPDIGQFKMYLHLKIQQFSALKKSCGQHTQYLGI